ncbi:MAG: ATP-binding protein [Lachnospiraceae bacterium]|nr:ATP-binding protein [Lachnospiraceae bacterium]
MSELNIAATIENLNDVMTFVTSILEEMSCPVKEQMTIEIAVEEMFVNVAHYAYTTKTGMVRIKCLPLDNNKAVEISFEDEGVPFNPLAKEDPDTTLSVEERPIGGLGIYMVKKSMDNVYYEYKDGKNFFRMRKNISA